MRSTTRSARLTVCAAVIVVACGHSGDSGSGAPAFEEDVEKAAPIVKKEVRELGAAIERGVDETEAAIAPGAEASFEDAHVRGLEGAARFYQSDTGVMVTVTLDWAPAGAHGVYIHKQGDCSDMEEGSMGPPFDAKKSKPGVAGARVPRLGNVGTIVVDDAGHGKLEFTVPGATLKPHDATSFLGRAIVIHSGKEGGGGVPLDSGDPIACGVITTR
jgi:Cu/Zn superoxide dismutase